MKTNSRRRFLCTGIAGGAAFAAISSKTGFSAAATRAPVANDVLRVGVIGTGARGKYLIANLPSSARVTAICDCATSRIASVLEPKNEFASVLAAFREKDAAHCATYQDYRLLLDRQKMDAVIIATPEHHHVLAAMLAMQAGLDVYVEKPLTVTIREGRLLANMVKKTGRVLQVGSQQRSMQVNRIGCEFIRNGGLGKIFKVELPNYPGPIFEPKVAEEPPVAGVDWDLFCGPTPLRAHHRNVWVKDEFKVGELLWRGWDLYRDYSGHMMTNWGAHSVDMVQYALGRDDTGPVEIFTVKPNSVDSIWSNWKEKSPAPSGAQERRFWPVTMRYADGVELQFAHGPDFIVFHGEKGRMRMRRNYFETDPPGLVASTADPAEIEKWKGTGNVARPHLENWIEGIRSQAPLNATVEVGHRTVTVCHLANIARELNRKLQWDPVGENFRNEPEGDSLLERPRRKGFQLPVSS